MQISNLSMLWQDGLGQCTMPESWGIVLFTAYKSNRPPLDGLLGEWIYMIRPWFMTPVQCPTIWSQRWYNFAHSSTCTTVQWSIGMAKHRWHCLCCGLQLQPQKACKVILVCFMLHNCARHLKLPPLRQDSDNWEDDDAGDEENDENPSLLLCILMLFYQSFTSNTSICSVCVGMRVSVMKWVYSYVFLMRWRTINSLLLLQNDHQNVTERAKTVAGKRNQERIIDDNFSWGKLSSNLEMCFCCFQSLSDWGMFNILGRNVHNCMHACVYACTHTYASVYLSLCLIFGLK